MNTFFIIKNGNGLIYCNKVKLGLSAFSVPNRYYDNVIKFNKEKDAEKTAKALNETFGVFQERQKDLFVVHRVVDYTEENVQAFEFINDFVRRYLAYDISKDEVDLGGVRFYDDKYYKLKTHKDGFICSTCNAYSPYSCSERNIYFDLDKAKTIDGGAKNLSPLVTIAKTIKKMYAELLKNDEFMSILESDRLISFEEKCKVVQDRFKEDGGFWETGYALPSIASYIAKHFDNDVVKINLPSYGFNCFGPANKIAFEVIRLMPFADEKMNAEDATTLFYGDKKIDKYSHLPFLADVDVFHTEKYEIIDGVPTFYLKRGRSWRAFL